MSLSWFAATDCFNCPKLSNIGCICRWCNNGCRQVKAMLKCTKTLEPLEHVLLTAKWRTCHNRWKIHCISFVENCQCSSSIHPWKPCCGSAFKKMIMCTKSLIKKWSDTKPFRTRCCLKLRIQTSPTVSAFSTQCRGHAFWRNHHLKHSDCELQWDLPLSSTWALTSIFQKTGGQWGCLLFQLQQDENGKNHAPRCNIPSRVSRA